MTSRGGNNNFTVSEEECRLFASALEVVDGGHRNHGSSSSSSGGGSSSFVRRAGESGSSGEDSSVRREFNASNDLEGSFLRRDDRHDDNENNKASNDDDDDDDGSENKASKKKNGLRPSSAGERRTERFLEMSRRMESTSSVTTLINDQEVRAYTASLQGGDAERHEEDMVDEGNDEAAAHYQVHPLMRRSSAATTGGGNNHGHNRPSPRRRSSVDNVREIEASLGLISSSSPPADEVVERNEEEQDRPGHRRRPSFLERAREQLFEQLFAEREQAAGLIQDWPDEDARLSRRRDRRRSLSDGAAADIDVSLVVPLADPDESPPPPGGHHCRIHSYASHEGHHRRCHSYEVHPLGLSDLVVDALVADEVGEDEQPRPEPESVEPSSSRQRGRWRGAEPAAAATTPTDAPRRRSSHHRRAHSYAFGGGGGGGITDLGTFGAYGAFAGLHARLADERHQRDDDTETTTAHRHQQRARRGSHHRRCYSESGGGGRHSPGGSSSSFRNQASAIADLVVQGVRDLKQGEDAAAEQPRGEDEHQEIAPPSSREEEEMAELSNESFAERLRVSEDYFPHAAAGAGAGDEDGSNNEKVSFVGVPQEADSADGGQHHHHPLLRRSNTCPEAGGEGTHDPLPERRTAHSYHGEIFIEEGHRNENNGRHVRASSAPTTSSFDRASAFLRSPSLLVGIPEDDLAERRGSQATSASREEEGSSVSSSAAAASPSRPGHHRRRHSSLGMTRRHRRAGSIGDGEPSASAASGNHRRGSSYGGEGEGSCFFFAPLNDEALPPMDSQKHGHGGPIIAEDGPVVVYSAIPDRQEEEPGGSDERDNVASSTATGPAPQYSSDATFFDSGRFRVRDGLVTLAGDEEDDIGSSSRRDRPRRQHKRGDSWGGRMADGVLGAAAVFHQAAEQQHHEQQNAAP